MEYPVHSLSEARQDMEDLLYSLEHLGRRLNAVLDQIVRLKQGQAITVHFYNKPPVSLARLQGIHDLDDAVSMIAYLTDEKVLLSKALARTEKQLAELEESSEDESD